MRGSIMVAIAFMLGALVCSTLQQQSLPLQAAAAAAAAGHQLPAVDDRFHQMPCPAPRQPGTPRRNLVVAAVGDGWTPSMWSHSEGAGWDLVAIYFGNRTDWSCAECMLALRMPDSMKWQMVYALMTEAQPQWRGIWVDLRRRYDYIMVADDDLIMDSCTIDIMFNTMREHKLLAAQPSNCRGADSDNPYWNHWQLPGAKMHYVNVIEVTAPAFHMGYLDKRVRPLLKMSYSGWGLPYCFSALTRFGRKQLGVIDGACMMHPKREDVGRRMSVSERIQLGLIKEGSIYSRFAAITPFKVPVLEQQHVWRMCGFTLQNARRLRQAFPAIPNIHGVVLLPGSPFEGPAAAPAQAQQAAGQSQQLQQQELLALASSGRLLRAPLLLLAQLGLAAAAGAVAFVRWNQRTKGIVTPARHMQVGPSPRTSPPLAIGAGLRSGAVWRAH